MEIVHSFRRKPKSAVKLCEFNFAKKDTPNTNGTTSIHFLRINDEIGNLHNYI